MSAKTTAQNIGTALRTEFPAQRFSLTTHVFEELEFETVYVTWIAGPTRAEVQAVTDAYVTSNISVSFDHIASA